MGVQGRQEGQLIHAPWSEKVVSALNAFQSSGWMHPFTCGGDHTSSPVLNAYPDGWRCPADDCEYTQGWAHAFMANRKLWENRTFAGMLNRRHCSDITPCGDASCRACYWRKEALEKGEKLRRESQLRQALYKGIRLLKEWPANVQVLNVALWLQDLLMGGPGTHLQDLYGSGHDAPMEGVWTGTVASSTAGLTFTVMLGQEEIPVTIGADQEAEFLAQAAAAHARWEKESDEG